MTVGEVLRRSAEYLAARDVETPRLDAELLLARALDLSRLELYLAHDRPLPERELDACRSLVRRRGLREPAAYVLGEWGFRRLTLAVDARALVPRPETEILVERCLQLLSEVDEPSVLDVGTGTGAIALSIADEHPRARVTALDASAAAVALARENAARTRLAGRVSIVHTDRLGGLAGFDLLVSNPPYVTAEELESLEPEVRDWEPREALLENGLTAAVAAAGLSCLRPGGWVVLEAASERVHAVARRLDELGYVDVRVTPDLAARPRVVEARRREVLG